MYADKLNPATPATLQLLLALVLQGAKDSGLHNTQDIQELFAGKQDLPQGAYDMKLSSPETLASMMQKANECNITLEKFKAIYSFK